MVLLGRPATRPSRTCRSRTERLLTRSAIAAFAARCSACPSCALIEIVGDGLVGQAGHQAFQNLPLAHREAADTFGDSRLCGPLLGLSILRLERDRRRWSCWAGRPPGLPEPAARAPRGC